MDAALPGLPIPSLRQPNWKEIPCLHQWSTSRCPSMGTSRVRRRTRQPRRRRLRAAARVVRHSGRGVFRPSGPAGQLIDEVNGSGALLTGRRTAEQADHWGGDIHGAPIFVMSHRPPSPSVANYPLVRYVNDGISAMAQAKAAAGTATCRCTARTRRSGRSKLVWWTAADPRDSGAVRRWPPVVRRVAVAH